MRSSRHKVLHPLAGRPLIDRVLDLVRGVGARQVLVVVGHQADQVRRALPEDIDTVVQAPQLGTGHAVKMTAERIQRAGATRVLVHYGDNALTRRSSLQQLIETGVEADAPVALLNARVRNPRGYGRILRSQDGAIVGTVEEVDASPEQRQIDEIWGGSMLVLSEWLWPMLEQLPPSPKGEYYLPDLVNLATRQGRVVRSVLTQDEEEVYGVNDRLQLAEANAIARRRTLDALMRSGVTIVDPSTTFVEPEVEIEPDVIIHPGCHLLGKTRVARGAEIGPNTFLRDTEVGIDSHVWYSVLEQANVGERVVIGPFSHLRPGAVIEDDVELGNYAEVKASRIGARSRMHHFGYVGDADVGTDVNVGAGAVTVNFNPETGEKSRTVIGDGASVGSDTMLVAPVTLGAAAATAAGAVVTRDIPPAEVWLGAPARPHRRRGGLPEAPPDTR